MASKRKLRREKCGSKVRFPDEASARATIGKMAKEKALNAFVRPYKCPFCHQWHFGRYEKRM